MKLVAGSQRGRRAGGRGGRRRAAPGAQAGRRDPDAGPGPVHDQPDRAGQEGRDRPGDRPRGRGPPDGRHPDPPPPEQPDPHRRGRRRQDGRRRGPGAADCPGRRSRGAQERRAPHPRPRPAPGRRRRQGGVREPAQAGHRRGQGFARADHPVHRRGPHHDRGRRPGRPERRRQPAQAGPGPRRAAHDRRHHLGRVQEVLREGRGAGAAVPGRQGRGARRGPRHPDDARDHRRCSRSTTACGSSTRPSRAPSSSRIATSRPGSSRTSRSACSTPPAPGWRSARTPFRRPSRTAAARSTTSSSSSASSTARARPARQHAERMAEVQQALDEARARLAELEARWEDERKRVEEIRGLAKSIEARYLEEKQKAAGSSGGQPFQPSAELAAMQADLNAKTDALRARPGRIAAVAGLGRLADHRRGDRRLDGHPRRQDARRRDPDRAQSAVEARGARHRPVARAGGDRPANPDRRAPT